MSRKDTPDVSSLSAGYRLFYAPSVRSIAMTALLGASFLATPLTAAFAADAPPSAPAVGAEATSMAPETVEQRITNLHTELMITAAEEAKWNNVAQAMRENAAAMEESSLPRPRPSRRCRA